MGSDLKVVNASLPLLEEGRLYTLAAKGGKWETIVAQEGYDRAPDAVSVEEWNGGADVTLDAKGNIVLPGLADAHMHLDKAFSLPQVGNGSGTLEEAVLNYSAAAPAFTKREIKARIMRSALQAVSFGTTHIRTHLDFQVKHGKEVAMRTVEAALEVKQELEPYVTIQLFPMLPYYDLTREAIEAAEEALRMGVTGVGGAPHLAPAPEPDIDRLFALAARFDRPLDLHTDESDDPNIRTAAYIARRTLDYGWSGRVTVDHLCSLAAMPDGDAARIIALMAEAGLSAVTLPGANMYLQGRRDSFPVRRGVTRVKELLAAGVPLASASDNIHDPFHPFGKGDLLQIALITAYAAHMGSPAEIRTVLRMITEHAAKVIGQADYGLRPGCDADMVMLDAASPEELFAMLPDRRWVWRKGKAIRLAGSKPSWVQPDLRARWEEAEQEVSFAKGREFR
ncbi:amidohydrolase family protein [Paenibacillus chartarius]|uniref:Amidohydrolase family protein n=1 Tax=Paenibacillus chartarius TaxID=747481 RepID=A0ABV6DH09_9BACL